MRLKVLIIAGLSLLAAANKLPRGQAASDGIVCSDDVESISSPLKEDLLCGEEVPYALRAVRSLRQDLRRIESSALLQLRAERDVRALLAGQAIDEGIPVQGVLAAASRSLEKALEFVEVGQPEQAAAVCQAVGESIAKLTKDIQTLQLTWQNLAWTAHLFRCGQTLSVKAKPPVIPDLNDQTSVHRAHLALADALARANQVFLSEPSWSRHNRLGWLPSCLPVQSDPAHWDFTFLPSDRMLDVLETRAGLCLYRQWKASPKSNAATAPASGASEQIHYASLSPFLSPGAYVLTNAGGLTLSGWEERNLSPPNALALAVAGKAIHFDLSEAGVAYDAQQDGPMSAAWMLIWNDVQGDNNPRPLLVLADEPVRRVIVSHSADNPRTVRIEMAAEDIAVSQKSAASGIWRFGMAHPFGQLRNLSADLTAVEIDLVQKWTAALRAVPVEYSELYKPGTAVGGDSGYRSAEATFIYDYAELTDAFGTRPARLAPLPMLYSLAVHHDMPGVSRPASAVKLLDLAEEWEYWAVPGSDRVTLSVPGVAKAGAAASSQHKPFLLAWPGMPGQQDDLALYPSYHTLQGRYDRAMLEERLLQPIRQSIAVGQSAPVQLDGLDDTLSAAARLWAEDAMEACEKYGLPWSFAGQQEPAGN